MSETYDSIGRTYRQTRKADARIVDRIVELLALPPGARVLDVGAGTGNYSRALAERGYAVTALEPSEVMRAQADTDDVVTWVAGHAEALPFADVSFDAAILILCVHHLADLSKAADELRRVVGNGPILFFTYDPDAVEEPWLFEYFPTFRIQIRQAFPSTSMFLKIFGQDVARIPFPLPSDLSDGFVGAAWRSPELYLEHDFRDGTSAFQQLDPELCQRGLAELSADLNSGAWDEQHGWIRSLDEYDHGYLFILAH